MSTKVISMENIECFVNRVIEADCLQVMPLIPDKSIDMILCDLPYGTTQNKWDSVIDLEKLWAEYMRIIKDNGVIVLTSQGLFTARLIMSNESWFKYKIVWIKSKSTNFLNAKKQPLRKHEDICVFYNQQPTYHPQMTQGECYDKGVRKDQFTLIAMQVRPGYDVNLIAALLNSVVTFLTLELKGTNRNLGALDLNATYFKHLQFLNPDLLSEAAKNDIITNFDLIKNRSVRPIVEEIRLQDRVAFDRAILRAYGIPESVLPSLYSLLEETVNIRISLKDK